MTDGTGNIQYANVSGAIDDKTGKLELTESQPM